MMGLKPELDGLESEILEAEDELIRLQARLSGLRAHRDALAAALATKQPRRDERAAASLDLGAIPNRTDAIVELLRDEGLPLGIEAVRDRLNSARDAESSYAVVASTLNLLLRTDRISRVARGRYAAR